MGKDTEILSTDYKGNTEAGVRQLVIPDAQGGQRLDQALSALLPEFSRNRIQNWIRARKIAVDDAWGTTKMKVSGGESVRVEIEPAGRAHLLDAARGDARVALNALEAAVAPVELGSGEKSGVITGEGPARDVPKAHTVSAHEGGV